MVDLLVFFSSGLLAKAVVHKRKKKDKIFLRSAIGTAALMCIANFLSVCFFCRVAEVSRAHREQLAKRERT